jgi:D-alanyl-D-alanine carboxypeptidase
VFKPRRKNWKVVLTAQLALLGLLFPTIASAEDPTPSPSPSVSASPEVSPSPDVTVDPIPLPIFNIDDAASLQVVVNKQRPLNPIDYAPKRSKSVNLAKDAAKAYITLKAAVSANKLGTLCLNSGYRSYATQKATHAYQVSRGKQYGYDGETVAARPGHSEHQTGLAADVSTTALGCRITNFGASKASKWIAKNAWQFGFVVRYPKGKEQITGYIWEPWHLRYVGLELATDMKAKGIKTLEEYFALPAAPKY